MTIKTINLTDLAETRSKMTPGEMTWESTGLLAVETNDPSDPIILGEVDLSEDNGLGIVAEHNAIGVLIEVARAAKDREAIDQVWRAVELCNIETSMTERRIIYGCLCDVRQRYDAALAEVTL